MRRFTVVLIATASALFSVAPAHAGGSWLGVREVRGTGGVSDGSWGGWAAHGSTITMRGQVCDGQQADPSKGPWTAYLRMLPDGARRPIGPVMISPLARGCHTASTTFVVPRVASGVYFVDVCADARCTMGVGDLVGGMFTVAATALEAQLLGDNARLHDAVTHLRRDRHRLAEQVLDLEKQVAQATDALDAAEAEGDAVRSEIDVMSHKRDALAAELEASRASANLWRLLTIAIGATLVALLGVGIVLARRRRTSAITVPDTPEELLASASSSDG